MDWNWLLLLACPIMMIFMMLGMGGIHKHGSKKDQMQSEQAIHNEIGELKAQNEQMRKEIQNLKES